MTTAAQEDGLRCAAMTILTCAHLYERGVMYRYAYAVSVTREDGECLEIACPTLEGVVNMVETMRPPALELQCSRDEDHDALLAMVRGQRPCSTLH
jgi:hypothetical protein